MAYRDDFHRVQKPLTYDSRSNNLSLGSNSSSGSSLASEIHKNFQPRNIIVFKNGDKFDTGMPVSVTRQQFQHWVSLIDFLTAKLKPTSAFNKLYTTEGEEVRLLKDLRNNQSYVAASALFKPLPYQYKPKTKDWSRSVVPKTNDITNLSSTETTKLYLKRNHFKQITNNQCWDDSTFDLLRRSTNGQSRPQQHQHQPVHNHIQSNFNSQQFSTARRSVSADRFITADQQYNRSLNESQRYQY